MTLSSFVLAAALAVDGQSEATADRNERAADAAERAAVAAQTAAEAVSRIAAVMEKLAAPPPAAEPAKAPEPPAPPPSPWSGSVGFGLISLTGNARSVTFNGAGLGQYKSDDWIFGLKATAVYGQSRAPDAGAEAKTLAQGAGVQLRGDRRFTPRFSTYLLAGAETDRVKSIRARWLGEVGLGLVWIETRDGDVDRTFLRTDLGFRYAVEDRFQYFPDRAELDDVTLVAPRLGLSFRHALSKNVAFQQELEVLPSIGFDRVLMASMSKLSARLTDSLSLTTSFVVTRDSKPAPGKETTDTALTVGLEVAL